MTFFIIFMVMYVLCGSVMLAYAEHKKETVHVLYLTLWIIGLILVAFVFYHLECNRYTDYVRIVTESLDAKYTNNYGELFRKYSVAPGSALIIALFTAIGNIAVLKSLAALVFFACLMYYCWEMLRKGLSVYAISMALLGVLSVTNLSYFADTIRFPLASSIFAFAVINYLYFGGSRRCAVYVTCLIACLIHVSIWPFFIILIVNDFLSGKTVDIFKIATLFYFFALKGFIEVIASINPALGWKLELYFNPDSQYYESIISKQQILFSVLAFAVYVAIIVFENRYIKSFYSKKSYSYIIWVCCFVAGSLPSNVTFSRLVPLLVLLSFPYICGFLESDKHSVNVSVGGGHPFESIPLRSFMFVIYIIICFMLRCRYSYAPFFIS